MGRLGAFRDAICDVRSPSEYEEDHVPGAINYPVLSDAERTVIGTMYKKMSPFAARREGAALVANNLADILRDSRWAELLPDSDVLVYCWRGGDRSLSLAHTLSRVGWNIFIVEAGYKGYRKSVRQVLEQMPEYKFHMIGGPTGSAKGLFLESLEALGAQVLDLEGAANHKGSVLGESIEGPQPSQKMFESKISEKLKGTLIISSLRPSHTRRIFLETLFPDRTNIFDPFKKPTWNYARKSAGTDNKVFAGFSQKRPIFVEDESYMVGRLHLPASLQKSIRIAPRTILHVPRQERVKWTRSQYKHFETTHIVLLRKKMEKLIPLR